MLKGNVKASILKAPKTFPRHNQINFFNSLLSDIWKFQSQSRENRGCTTAAQEYGIMIRSIKRFNQSD